MQNSFCYKCKLFVNCESPCLPNLATNPEAKLLIVGPFPSATDDKNKRIFSSNHAKMFLDQVSNKGLKYQLTNIVKCTPYKVTSKTVVVRGEEKTTTIKTPAKPTLTNQKSCLPNFYKLVDEMKPKVIVTVGSLVTNSILHLGLSIDKARGYAYFHPELNAFVVPVYDFDMYKDDTVYIKHLHEDLARISSLMNTRGFRKSISTPVSLKDPLEIETYLKSLHSSEKIAVDLETTGLNPRIDRITDISICKEVGKGVHIRWKDILPFHSLLKTILEEKPNKLIGQNAKFDRSFLLHNGIDTGLWYFDTMLGYHTLTMMHEGASGGLYKLDRLSWIFTHQGNYKSILEQWGGISKYQESLTTSTGDIPAVSGKKTKPKKPVVIKEVHKPVVRLPIYQDVAMFSRDSYEEDIEELEDDAPVVDMDINYACRGEYASQIGNPLIESLMNRTTMRKPGKTNVGAAKEVRARVSSDFAINEEEEESLLLYENMVSKRRLEQLEKLNLTPLEYYAAMDADVTLQVANSIIPLIEKDYKSLYWGLIGPLNNAITIMENHGLLVDVDYIKDIVIKNEEAMKIHEANIYKAAGKDFNIASSDEMRTMIYTTLKVKEDPKYMTKGGKTGAARQPSVDQYAMEHFSKVYPNKKEFFDNVLAYRKLEKENSTYFNGFLDLVDPASGRVHGSYLQTTTATGRLSCIAEGTKISCVGQDKNIEDVVVGDLVYCYDAEGKLRISKVTNTFDNGIQECVKVRWQSSGNGKIGELLCTPDHKIFTKYKGWVEAKDLKRYDKVYHLKKAYNRAENGVTLYGTHSFMEEEHRVIKTEYFKADSKCHIHHKDENRLNNLISNLEILSAADHTRYHGLKRVKEGKAVYAHLKYCKKVPSKGANNKGFIACTKESLEKMIRDARGKYSTIPMDFDTFRLKCAVHNVDFKAIATEYSRTGLHITKEVMQEAILKRKDYIEAHPELKDPLWQLQYDLKITPNKVRKLLKYYDISINHTVTKVTPIGVRRVYDLEVEGYHNFIANEICVHNCTAPNLQNIPKASYVRNMVIPSPGCKLVGADLSQAELRILAMVSDDKNMRDAFTSGFDFHAFTAATMFGISVKDFDHNNNPKHKELRNVAKCVHPGTLICVDRQIKRIGRVVTHTEQDTFQPSKIFNTIWDGGKYIPLKSTYKSIDDERLLIMTRRGPFACSKIHQVTLEDGTLCQAQHLKKGDILQHLPSLDVDSEPQYVYYNPVTENSVGGLKLELTPDWAYIAGVFTGDGVASINGLGISTGVGGKYEDWLDSLVDSFSKIGVPVTKRNNKVYQDQGDGGVHIGSVRVCRLFDVLGLVTYTPHRCARTYRIPEWALNNKELAWQFLGGLIDSDGTISPDEAITISTKSWELLQDICVLLQVLGLEYTTRDEYNPKYDKYYFEVRIRSKYIQHCKEQQILRCPWKKEILSTTTAGSKATCGRIKGCEVIRIENLGVGELVDIEVDTDDHLYWMAGFKGHNTINFGLAYGRGASSIAEQVNSSVQEAEEFMNKFFKSYPNTKVWMDDTKAFARKHGYVETVHGRRRYLPYINSSDPSKRNHAENQAINTPIQGTASDCACYGLINITEFAINNGYTARPCMIIHDEIQMDVPDNEVEIFAKQLPISMTENIPLITIVLEADSTILDRWEK